jgi:TonB family protein
MRYRRVSAFGVLCALSTAPVGAQPKPPPAPTSQRPANKAVMLEAPPPDLIQLRQHQGVKGDGVFRLHIIPKTGKVTSVEIRKSTGSRFLDQLTIDTLSRWRAKPGGNAIVDVPITYTARYP